MKRPLSLVALALVVTLTGCGSMIPGSEKVVFTRNPADVVNCKLVVPTRYYPYRPMYGIHNDKAIKDAVYAEGGDTVLLVKPILYAATGIAYNCHGEDPRHPFPVDPKPEAAARPPTATSQPALAVGTKLFSNDGAPFGTVVLTSDTSVAVSLVGGGTVTMTIEQAVGMQTKKDQVATTPLPGESPAPAAAPAPTPARMLIPTPKLAPQALAVGTKLFNKDGSVFGTVTILSRSAVAVLQANGSSTVTLSREQAVSMQR
jgi:hypothetical protein